MMSLVIVRVCRRARPPSGTAGHPRGALCPSGVGPGPLRAVVKTPIRSDDGLSDPIRVASIHAMGFAAVATVIDPFFHRLGQHDDALVALEELLEVWPPAPIMAPMGGPPPSLRTDGGACPGWAMGYPKSNFTSRISPCESEL